MGGPEELRRRYVERLRREGTLTPEPLARAFATVPREVFVQQGFHHRGRRVTPDDEGFLDAVYTNDVLVTKVIDGVPVSSSSQPSLMAVMLDSLDLSPGMRVLEIGSGTGYNAALMAALGVRVTSIDVQPDVLAAAAAGLDRAGVSGVRLRNGDGYRGEPVDAPYHRVVATVGVAGVSPSWFDQLSPGGFVLAPVAHAGTHPVLRAWRDPQGAVRARALCSAGFMSAAGPLSARYRWAHPEPLRARTLPATTVSHPGRWRPALDVFRYHDLWFAVGAWHRRATFAAAWEVDGSGGCALLDEARAGGAGILPDGGIRASGAQARRYATDALALLDRWARAGAPGVADWSTSLVLAGDPAQPIWVPRRWRLVSQPG